MAGEAFALDPGLDPLGNYGGPTKTHRLETTSIAIDPDVDMGPARDQRG